MDNLNLPFIAFFYGCCALLVACWYGFWQLTNRAKFRSDEDATMEIGYEEDSVGRVIRSYGDGDGDDSNSIAHVQASGNLGTGPM